MVQFPDRLECLFSASIDQQDGSYSIEIPRSELEQKVISSGDIYRVAVLPQQSQIVETDARPQDDTVPTVDSRSSASQPPVSEGDVRTVEIETLGDRGDGIAKIDRGYVVIVPETEIGDEVSIEITQTRENVAFARVRDDEPGPDESAAPDESIAGDTLGTKK